MGKGGIALRIVVDAMGGDNAPREIVLGCLNALRKDTRLTIALVGKQDMIYRVLESNTNERLEVIDATEIITNEESPVEAIRRKKNSSMVVGMDMVKRGEAAAFISAGNTGALMAGALFRIGRIEGIDRPALAPIIPTLSGGSMLIDVGANADCKPKNLLQFGLMGSAYMERVAGVAKPRVALVNVGSEKGKGNQLTKEAFELLEASNLNFIGNIEARDIPEGKAEVLVCDGFVGNVILKLIEGLAMSIFSELKKEFTAGTAAKLAAAVLKPGLKRFKSRLDYKEYGGAPLLGVSGGCIKAHGSSDAKAMESAVFQAVKFIDMQVLGKIKEEI